MSVHPSATSVTRRMPNASGTAFDPDRHGDDNPFRVRESYIEYEPLADFLPEGRAAARARNAKALHRIALETLTEPRLDDPNVRYSRAVLVAVLDDLQESGRPLTTKDMETLTDAADQMAEHAALSVARAWLRERGSIPVEATASERKGGAR